MTIAPANGHIFQTLDETQFIQSKPEYFDQYFLGEKRKLLPGPEAFYAECDEGRVITSHFHKVDQFQILYGHPGAYYQRTPLPKALLHYADAYSVYGPFGAGPEHRLNFFTLRSTASDFRGNMPEKRSDLLYRGKRHFTIDLEPLMDGVVDRGEVRSETLFEPHADGLAAHVVNVGPDTPFTPPIGELRQGRFCVVLKGELQYNGRSFDSRSLGWSAGETPEMEGFAGTDGAILLFLNMPYPSTPMTHTSDVEDFKE